MNDLDGLPCGEHGRKPVPDHRMVVDYKRRHHESARIKSLMLRLDVSNAAQAINRAYELGILRA